MRSVQDPTILEYAVYHPEPARPGRSADPPPHPAWSPSKGYETPCARVRSMHALQLLGLVAVTCNDRPWPVVG